MISFIDQKIRESKGEIEALWKLTNKAQVFLNFKTIHVEEVTNHQENKKEKVKILIMRITSKNDLKIND